MKKIITLLFLAALVCVKGWGQTTQTFTYTTANSGNQIFTVPTGVSSISVKIWGAGGGGSSTGGSGGSGALVKGTIPVTAGQTLTIVVGGGGVYSNSGSTGTTIGGGGSSYSFGASGGGYSGIFNTSTVSQANALAIAGGGGGGGYYQTPTYGGGGGATTGTPGGNVSSNYTGGAGGSTSAGGGGGLYNNSSSRSNAGSSLAGGGAFTGYTYGAGGGGGGYYGGGSGYSSNSNSNASSGGGGGASFLGSITSPTNTAGTIDNSQTGNATQAPGSSETGYLAGDGNGGNASGTSGGNGLVIISYTAILTPPTITSFTPTTVCSSGGTSITITGTNFTGATAVKFNGTTATFTVVNATTITAVSPNGATAGTISVTTPGGTATSTGSYTVTTAPSASFSYSGTPFCTTASPVTPTFSGTTGGTFTSTAGLTINSSTGVITPATSTAGTYTVTYTVSASGGCSVYTTTASVTITAAPSATISYASPFCSTTTSASPTITGTQGGTFSSTTGLSITSAGVINPSASTAGTYTVTYTVAASGGCSIYTTTASVTINTAPTANISYSGTPFCSNTAAGSATSPTISGQTGGTFSSTAGLTINGTTGVINPTTSTAGTYTVTYSFTNGTCSNTTTASVTINTAPSATISYASPFCSTVASAPVTRTGTSGGTYSSTTGLTISSTTGTITPSSSTAGTYTVTYAVAASGGCSVYTTTASVTINAAPTATVSYSGTPFCSNTAAGAATTPTVTGGNTTVSFTSTAGLSINSSTGVINPSASTVGNYTVTYTFTNGTCQNTATTSVTVTAAPSATISYSGSPYCSTLTSVNVTRTGTSGGTYSSAAGLSINSSSGTINPSASTPGTYTVTYTVAASGGCSVYTTTAPAITITANPSGTFSYNSGLSYCSTVTSASPTTSGLTAGGSYSVSPSSGLASFNSSTGAFNPSTSTAGTYTVTYTVAASGGCSAYTTTAGVTINPAAPTLVSVTPSSATACSGASTTLGASATTSSSKITTGSDNFNGTPTYTIAGSGTSGSGHYQVWAQVSSPYSNGNTLGLPSISSPDNSKFMLAWVNNFYSATVNSTLTSQAINTTSYSNLSLSFQYTYYQTSTGVFTVEVSTDGITFTTFKTYNSTSTGAPSFTTDNINLGSYINKSTLYIRFHANLSNTFQGPGAYLAVDNVTLNGASLPFFSWTASPSGTAGLPSGAGTFSTANQSISVQPTATTVYTLTAQDPSTGCNGTSTATSTITVNPLPTPTFTTAPGSQVCGKTDVTYTTQAGQTNYTWTGFGTPGTDYTITSGSLSTTSNTVTVQWLTAGSHMVTVNYSNGNCNGATAATSTTTVLAYPAAYTVTGGGAYCSNDGGQTGSGQTISLSGSQTGVTYTLYLNNSPTTTTQSGNGSALNFFGVLGQGTYTVFATNTSTNCTQFMTGSASITVNAFPNDYAVTGSGTTCGTGTISLSGSDLNTTYNLRLSGTTVSSQVGTGSALNFTVTQSGTYSIIAANSSCQNGMGSAVVTVNPRPTPSFTTAPTGTPCQNTSVTYTTQAGQSSYVWTVPGTANTDYTITAGGISSTDNTVTLTWLTAGSKTVTVNYNNSFGCNGTSAATSTITVNPNATIALTSGTGTNAQTVCTGVTIAPITYSIGGGGTNATVSGLPSGISGTYSGGIFTISGSATVSTATTYNYTVTTTGTCTQTSATGFLTINSNATIALTSGVGTNAQSICSGNAISNITYAIGGGGTNASVTGLPNGVSGSYSNGVVTISGMPTQTGTFNYTVTTTGSCTQTTATGSITINQTPTAIISGPSSAICAGSGSGVTISSTTGGNVYYHTSTNANEQSVSLAPNGGTTLSDVLQQTTTYTLDSVRIPGACLNLLGTSVTVTVNAIPDATITIAPNNGSGYVQIGSSVQYKAAGSGTWSSDATDTATVDNTGNVTGVGSGHTTIRYTLTQNNCTGNGSLPIIVTADFITKQAGKFSDFHTWNQGTTSGLVASISPIPDSTKTVEIQHVDTLDINFAVGTGKSFNITGSGTMTIAPNAMLLSLGTVAFNGNHVTVQSNATGTGAIGYMAVPITGATNVTVERYIPLTTTNGSAGRTGRAWRLLTSPVTGMTIQQAWQEGKTWQGGTTEATTGLGTIITGQGIPSDIAGGTASSTFDFIPASGHNSSILQYNPGTTTTTGTWQVPSINSTPGTNTLVNTQPAWMLFVRGDRTANTAAAKGTTTLRATGTLNQGDQPAITVSGNKAFTLVGNPFAAPIDFEQIYQANAISIAPQFVTWNSKNGVYGAYTLTMRNGPNDYTVVPNYLSGGTGTPGDANARFIMSGEGFLVQPATTGTDGSLVIPKAAKDSFTASAGINPYRISASTEGRLFVNLNLAASGSGTDTAAVLADGVMARFDKSYQVAIDGDDIRKQSNFNENLGIESNSISLIVEARPAVQKTDTVQLKLWNITSRQYQLQLKGDNFAQMAATQGLHAYVEDSYLKTHQEISLSGSVTTVAFAVTSDAASYDSHRFRVVFQTEASSILPITLTSVKAVLQNGGVSVSWSTQNEVNVKQYGVERSVDGGTTFSTTIATVAAKNNGATAPLASYATLDAAPQKGDDYYRIRIEGADGKVTYSNVVKVTVGEDVSGKTLITLYPNPVSRREGKATLSLQNVKSGDYLMSVYSSTGQNIAEKKITVAGGSRAQSESVPLPQSLAQGAYQLQLTDINGTKVFVSKFIVGK